MVDEDSTGQSSGEAAHEEHLGIGYQLIFIVLEINLGILVSGIVMRSRPVANCAAMRAEPASPGATR